MSTETKLSIIKKDFEIARPSFEQLNLTGLSFAKEMEFAMQIFEKNLYMQGASAESVRRALINIALTGLTLNPVMKLCYILPRKNKTVLECVVEPSYMGLIKILTDTGSVLAISATIVYEKEADSLVIQEGAGGHASHTHYVGFDKPGRPVACYAQAILPSGVKQVFLLRPWQWEDIKKRSESVKSYLAKKAKNEYAPEPTWMTDEEEMIRKSTIKNIYKYLPKTKRAEEIAAVIQLDNEANGIDFEEKKPKITETPPMTVDILDNGIEENVKRFSELIELAKDGTIPNVYKTKTGEFNMAGTIQSLEDDFAENKLHQQKFEKLESTIKKTHAYFKSQPNDNN